MIFNDLKVWLVGTIIIIIFSLLIHYQSSNRNDIESLRCHWSLEMERDAFSGVLIRKFFDPKNHLKPTLELENKKSFRSIDLINEKSGFYDFIEIGDSIFKEENSLIVFIWRNNKKIDKKLDYLCNPPDVRSLPIKK